MIFTFSIVRVKTYSHRNALLHIHTYTWTYDLWCRLHGFTETWSDSKLGHICILLCIISLIPSTNTHFAPFQLPFALYHIHSVLHICFIIFTKSWCCAIPIQLACTPSHAETQKENCKAWRCHESWCAFSNSFNFITTHIFPRIPGLSAQFWFH